MHTHDPSYTLKHEHKQTFPQMATNTHPAHILKQICRARALYWQYIFMMKLHILVFRLEDLDKNVVIKSIPKFPEYPISAIS